MKTPVSRKGLVDDLLEICPLPILACEDVVSASQSDQVEDEEGESPAPSM